MLEWLRAKEAFWKETNEDNLGIPKKKWKWVQETGRTKSRPVAKKPVSKTGTTQRRGTSANPMNVRARSLRWNENHQDLREPITFSNHFFNFVNKVFQVIHLVYPETGEDERVH